MAAPTEYYVDPSIAASSGAGTVGDPYGDIQHALDTVTRDSSNGDKFNIKAGTDEILSSSLSLTTYGTPTRSTPCMFRGYTTTADDGGIGGISGNASVSVINNAAYDGVWFIDMHLHNTGSNVIVFLDQYCFLVNCEIDNSTSTGAKLDGSGAVQGCYFHNISGSYALQLDGDIGIGNSFEPDGRNPTVMISMLAAASMAVGNLITCASSTDGIDGAQRILIANNTIYSSGGTGQGITGLGTDSVIINNIIEGFSGVGGIGLNSGSSSEPSFLAHNAAYNNTTNYNMPDFGHWLDNDTLGASPFTNAGAGDFSLTTNADVKATAFPLSFLGMSQTNYLDKGAVQREEPAGGGGGLLTHPGLRGGING